MPPHSPSRRSNSTVALALATALAIFSSHPAHAVDWKLPTIGDWAVDTSWVGDAIPDSSDEANVNNGGTAIINAADSLFASEVHMGLSAGDSGNLIMNGGTLRVHITPRDTDDNAFAVADRGAGTFTLNAGEILLGNLTQSNAPDFHVGKSTQAGAVMTMNGGVVRMHGTLRIARGQAANANGTLNILGGEFNVGTGVVVARGNAGNRAEGTFVVGGTGKYISGNSFEEGSPTGAVNEGFFSIANSPNTFGHVTVKDSGVVKALRLTGRQGTGDLTIRDNARFLVVNSLGATGNSGILYGSYLGGGSASSGDGNDGGAGNYTLNIEGNGLLDIDANAATRDPTRPELQGFILARGNSSAAANINGSDFAQDNLIVRQHFVIGGLGAGAKFEGPDGLPDPGTNPAGTATVNLNGGTVTADHLVIGGSGVGTMNVTRGLVRTQAFASTFDPTDTTSEPGKTSVNAIRIAMFEGSSGTLNVSGGGIVSSGLGAGDLSIGHYGNGIIKITGPNALVIAKDVYLQKFPGSTATVYAEITAPGHGRIRANNNVVINGGTLSVIPTNVPSGANQWVILQADADNNAAGTLTGRFDTDIFPDETDRRRWSLFYTDKQAIVGLTIPGDANFDGAVNFTDLVALAQNYNGPGQWPTGDFSGDGIVAFADLVDLAQNYNTTIPTSPIPGASPGFHEDVARAFAQAPEPSTAAALTLLACGFANRRPRRRAA